VSCRAILIAGPTASGKSALALRLAVERGGVVINADSMQVYSDLSILTARPGPSETAVVRHMLYGCVAGSEPYSVGRWLVDAQGAIEACWQEGALPIVTGGTGLYFKALLQGLAPIPSTPASIRAHWRDEARRLGAGGLHDLLKARDPRSASLLRPTDTQRLTRALEVLDATGRSLSAWQQEPGTPVLRMEEVLALVVAPDRETLRRRADTRLDAMMAAGALEEVRALVAKGYAEDLPVMRALGVPPLAAALRGVIPLAEAVDRAKIDTRQYIKRQETWLRRNMMSWTSLDTQ